MEEKVLKTSNSGMPELTDNQASNFEGYTLDELRYQRALLALRKEFCKSRVLNQLNNIREGKTSTDSKGRKTTRMGGVLGKVMSSLNYIDYALMGYSLFGTGLKVFKFFRRSK